jgi:rubrerythrin
MTILRGSHTEKNLRQAMIGEALAYIKYQIYASLIGKTSKDLEAKINHIAHNEKEHYKIWAKLLLGDDYYNNKSNLIDAIVGEVEECESLYPDFARMAREEGFDEIAEKFEMVSSIECNHSWQFEEFLDLYQNGYQDGITKKGFICLNCGYIHQEDEAPDICPVCDHPKEYFKRND